MHVNVAKESYSPSTVSSLGKAPNVQSRYIFKLRRLPCTHPRLDRQRNERASLSEEQRHPNVLTLLTGSMTMIPNLPPPPASLSWLHVQLLIRCCWILSL